MLLGKRQRHPMKRTTSMSDIILDPIPAGGGGGGSSSTESGDQKQSDGIHVLEERFSPGTQTHHRKTSSSSGFLETPFLRSCSLCSRRLVAGRDIYMYRGDSAFCSLECRQHQMNHDERIEKCSLASKKEVIVSTTGASQVSTKAAV